MSTELESTRRSFFWKAGAVLSAPVAAATTYASEAAVPDSGTLKRLAQLEDEKAIRELQETLIRHVNAGARDAIHASCIDATAVQLDDGIRSLAPDSAAERGVIEVAVDRLTAVAATPCTALIETAIGPNCTLVEMARLQGEGVVRHTCSGVLEGAYSKHNGVWRIERIVFS
jgi:hypothetical protein